jgi:hypothetical protein
MWAVCIRAAKSRINGWICARTAPPAQICITSSGVAETTGMRKTKSGANPAKAVIAAMAGGQELRRLFDWKHPFLGKRQVRIL